MLTKGPAKRVTIFINEDTRHGIEPLWKAVFEFLVHRQAAGATVLRPWMGFGSHHHVRSPDMEATMEHLPVRIEFVDTPERVQELLPTLYDMVTDGLIEVQDTTVIKAVQKTKLQPQQRAPHARNKGPARMMRIFLGEGDKWHGEPLYDAIVKRFRMENIAGATVYKGVLGYGAKGHTHRGQGLFHSHDCPVMISVIDSDERVKSAMEILDEMLQDGLVVLSDVDVVRFAHPSVSMEANDAGNAAR
jgi:PII-like signaling protein